MSETWTDYQRRLLIEHLLGGGLILKDDSGCGWATASRSLGGFQSELAERLLETGFRANGGWYDVVEFETLPGRFGCLRRQEAAL
jgi:hypothetical protein